MKWLSASRAAVCRLVQRWVAVLGGPRLFSYTLFWMMVLVFFGTLAQRELGLYQARENYLHSWWLWGGTIPLPGGLLTMSLIGISLIARMAQRKYWRWRSAGTLLLHGAALLLLFGGLLTLIFAQEGNLVLREGETSALIHAHEDLEFVVIEEDVQDIVDSERVPEGMVAERVTAFAEGWLQAGAQLSSPIDFPFRIDLWSAARNCVVKARLESAEVAAAETTVAEGIPRRGAARNLSLESMPLARELADNSACALFHLQGADAELDGLYASYEFMVDPPTVYVGDRSYRFEIRRRQDRLPFQVELLDFVREFHPSTTIARGYSSTVRIIDGSLSFERTISMNRPLRYRGYTLYQASFIEDDDGEASSTVLAAVRNAGRIFPYLSGVLMCLGLLWHLGGRLPPLFARQRRGHQ